MGNSPWSMALASAAARNFVATSTVLGCRHPNKRTWRRVANRRSSLHPSPQSSSQNLTLPLNSPQCTNVEHNEDVTSNARQMLCVPKTESGLVRLNPLLCWITHTTEVRVNLTRPDSQMSKGEWIGAPNISMCCTQWTLVSDGHCVQRCELNKNSLCHVSYCCVFQIT